MNIYSEMGTVNKNQLHPSHITSACMSLYSRIAYPILTYKLLQYEEWEMTNLLILVRTPYVYNNGPK